MTMKESLEAHGVQIFQLILLVEALLERIAIHTPMEEEHILTATVTVLEAIKKLRDLKEAMDLVILTSI